jgi:tetratricopeptide (TPR) repeat protein
MMTLICKPILITMVSVVCFVGVLPAQTVIDMDKGGQVRNKTLRDYDRRIQAEVLKEDSLKYVDCLTRAFNALYVDSLTQAQTFFQEALALRPDAPGNYIVRKHLAEICEARGELKEASMLYSKILKEHPEMHQVRIARAAVNVQMHYYQEAQVDCDYLLSREYNALPMERLYFIRATALMGMRQNKEARKDLERVVLLNPDNLNAPIMLALSFYNDGQPQEALNRLNLHLQSHPKNIDALLLRANFFMEIKRYEAALDDLTAVLTMAPKSAEAYMQRAACYEKLGKLEAAQADRMMVGKLMNAQP